MVKIFIRRISRIATGLGFALVLLLGASHARAQILSRGDLFGPGAPPPMLGIEVGFGSHSQQGSFQADCGCTFQSGTGSGFLGSIVFELPLDYSWALGLKTSLDFKNTTSNTIINEPTVIHFIRANLDDSGKADHLVYTRIGYVKTTYLEFVPFVQYQFFRMGPFVQLGLNVAVLMANHFLHTRELGSTTAQLSDGSTIYNLRFTNGTRDETLQDDKIPNANGLRLGALISLGYDLSLSERSVLAPMVSYDLPFTTVSNVNAAGWKVASLYGSIELKFKLN